MTIHLFLMCSTVFRPIKSHSIIRNDDKSLDILFATPDFSHSVYHVNFQIIQNTEDSTCWLSLLQYSQNLKSIYGTRPFQTTCTGRIKNGFVIIWTFAKNIISPTLIRTACPVLSINYRKRVKQRRNKRRPPHGKAVHAGDIPVAFHVLRRFPKESSHPGRGPDQITELPFPVKPFCLGALCARRFSHCTHRKIHIQWGITYH